MRLRIPEVFEDRTPYEVARDSGGRLNEATLYRLARERGRLESVNMSVLQALCDVLKRTPGELFDYEEEPVEKPAKRSRKAARRRR